MGRKIIILSDRRLHLNIMLKWLNNHNIPSGLYVGGMKPFELHDCKQRMLF